MSPREELARRQAELLHALLEGGSPPPGFDLQRLAVEAQALLAKRRRIAQHLRPDLADALTDTFDAQFAEYAVSHPRRVGVSARQDVAELEQWLIERGALPKPRRRWLRK